MQHVQPCIQQRHLQQHPQLPELGEQLQLRMRPSPLAWPMFAFGKTSFAAQKLERRLATWRLSELECFGEHGPVCDTRAEVDEVNAAENFENRSGGGGDAARHFLRRQ